MNLLRACTLACLCTLPLVAAAQWQWVDKSGRKVFSDQAPPPDIPAKNILRQPGARPADAAPAPAADAPVAAVSAPRAAGRDKALEERRKAQESAESEKAKALAAQVAAQREESCRRGRQDKATYASGARVMRVNEKGEREYLDDKQRATEMQAMQAVIDRDCKPAQ